jgi:RsiW-degrading membrane proteinase PrsW (M82 family)
MVMAALLLAGLPSLVFVLLLNAIDRFEKEPFRVLAASAVLGAIGTPLLSIAVLILLGRGPELPLGYATGGTPDPLARIVEQVIAGALLLLLVRGLGDEFDDTLDGIVYGGAIGAGLGAAETFLFVVGGTGQLGAGTIAGLLVAGLNQAFYGAVLGAIVGVAWRWEPRRRWLVIALGVATAALLSALHDTLPSILSRLVQRPSEAIGAATRLIALLVNVLGIAALAVAVVASWRREARIVRIYLAPEVPSGIASPEDIDRLTAFRPRLGRQAATLRRQGLRGLRALRRLEAAQGELAFRNWHETRRRHRSDGTADELRKRIRDLRATLDGRAEDER